MNLFTELRRRNVVRVAGLYVVSAWLLIQVAETLLPIFGTPDWVLQALVVLLALGFVVALGFSWVFQLTPHGIARDTGAVDGERQPAGSGRLDLAIIGLLLVVGALLLWQLLHDRDASAPAPMAMTGGEAAAPASVPDQSAPTPDGRTIAVLPFENLSSDPEQGYFADGLTEEILNVLSSVPGLRVTARTSSFHYKDKDVPVDEIGERLGVEHILEGSVRRAGDRMRVTAQLVRARDGFHVWSSSYDRHVDDAFEVQADVAAKVAAALGILLDEEQRQRMESAGVRDPEAYALYAQGFELYQLAHGGAPQIPTLAEANEMFDRAVEKAPDLWAASFHSADLYGHLLLELASGAEPESLPLSDVPRIREEFERRLHAAMRAAPNAAARDFIDITRRLLSDDWTGVGDLARRAITHTDACGFDQWMHVATTAFGMAEPARDFFVRGTRCNALDEANWIHASIASIYTGDPAGALELADRGIAVTHDIRLEEARFDALLALGRFDEARASLTRLPHAAARTRSEARLAAASGDRAATESALEKFVPEAQQLDVQAITLAAQSGDREAASRLAAAIDARPAGPLLLMVAVHFCYCGAPFDLDAAPNLAARLQEADLAWPPTQAIDWPLAAEYGDGGNF